jgi:hypothetical protein
VYTYFVNDATTPRTSWWAPNATARYVVAVENSGSVAGDGTVLKVPASAGLAKTGAACVAWGGAQCPGSLTVAQLESGIAVPKLPEFGWIRIAFEATVTAALGTSVTATAMITPPPGKRDQNAVDDTATQTQAVLVPSTDNVPGTLVAAGSSTTPPMQASGGTLGTIGNCQMAGPAVATSAASPTGVVLTWAHINGARYTVSRDDVGALTPTPITEALYPSTVTFTHSAPMYAVNTYRYSVRADYGGGCGLSHVAVVPAGGSFRPLAEYWDGRGPYWWGREVSTDQAIVWAPGVPLGTPAAASGGVLIYGHGMPADGYEAHPWDCESLCRRTFLLGPGEYTWFAVPYWDTQGGRIIDTSAGTRVTVRVP